MGVKGLLAFIVGALLLSTAQAAVEKGPAVLSNVPEEAQGTTPQPPAMKIYKYTNRSGVRSYSDRAPVGISYEVMQFSCFACNPRSAVDWHNIPLQLSAYEYAINSSAKKYRVDPALVRAVIHAESAFRPGARSNKGALGLMQLMPDTARDMGVENAMSPDENIQGGVRYLAWLLEQNSGNTMLATAAYNAGPAAVKRYNGIPPFEETQTYVKRVKLLHDRYKKALNKTFSGRYVSQANNY
jgi:soluble lytic murein transglycosylase-like protein